MQGSDIARMCADRGWSRSRLVLELRKAARRDGVELPADDSLKRMIRLWNSGERGVSSMYAELLTRVFGVPFESVEQDGAGPADDAGALAERLASAAALDAELVELFEQQTHSMRMLDRRLGARRLLAQAEAHVQAMRDVLTYAAPGTARAGLAAAVAEGAALAGWQALDLGQPDKAWKLHETAKAAANESNDPAVWTHVHAQQAYALLDIGRAATAVRVVQHAQTHSAGAPAVMRAWLHAAEAEMLATAGDELGTRRALDLAAAQLDHADGESLPYLALDAVHLGRWRGHCLARLGAREAVDDLTVSLAGLDATFVRARAALYCDLALAHTARGEADEAQANAQRAVQLADATTSARQKRRLAELLRKSA